MANDTTFIAEQVNEASESWKPDHNQAMLCRDLEDLLSTGISLFRVIRLADERWSKAVEDGKQRFDPKRVRQINAGYIWWLKPVPQLLKILAKIEEQFHVQGAGEFRDCVRQAKNLTCFDAETLIASQDEAAHGKLTDWQGAQA